MKNRTKYVFSFSLILFLLLGISYAFFSYTKNSDKNNQIIAGDIYFHFYETGNEVVLTNAFPETKEEARSHNDNFTTFSINGLNTYQKKNIYYEIVLIEGEEIKGKQRLNPKDIKFDLVEIIDGEENYLIQNFSYTDFNNKRIYVDTIPALTTTEINRTYQLRMWVSEDVIISDTEDYADYTTDEYANSYASIKVLINGDFTEKTYESQILSTNIIQNINTSGIIGITNNGVLTDEVNNSREFRYSGIGKYCTYTQDGVNYEMDVDSNYCPKACIANDLIYDENSDYIHILSATGACIGTIVTPNETIPNDADVNNYIKFNNEMWRIIGVFETENKDGLIDYRVKIVRDHPLEESPYPRFYNYNNEEIELKRDYTSISDSKQILKYGYYNFSKNLENDYSRSSLMDYLNNEDNINSYYNTIDNEYKNMIEDVKYYLGTISSYKNASIMYQNERYVSCENTTGVNSNKKDYAVSPLTGEPSVEIDVVCNIWEGSNPTWTGKIGLMYPSDYGYASNPNNWTSTNYGKQNWMNNNKRYSEFLISPSNYLPYYVSILYISNKITDNYQLTNYGAVSPVLYLKSDILFISGNGTESNPYLIEYSE